MDVSCFRLLQLPQNAFFNVLCSMHTVEVVLLSLVSKKSAVRVKSLNFECRHSCVKIQSRTISVKINMFGETMDYVDFKFIYRSSPQCDVNQPHRAKLCTSKYNQSHLPVQHRMGGKFGSLQFWMDHLTFLFDFTKVRKVLWFKESQFNLQSIRRTFPKFDFLAIEKNISLEINRQILETFPNTNSLYIENHAFQESKFPDQVLFGNYDQLSVGGISDHETLLKLDDILQMKSKEISIANITLKEKELNRLLKLWVRGAWPRLERVMLAINMGDEAHELDIKAMLKEIKYRKVPDGQEQEHQLSFCGSLFLKGGYDIWRKDGTRATVEWDYHDMQIFYNFYVWHPHCIGNNG